MGEPQVPQGGDSNSLLTPNHLIVPIVQMRKRRLREGALWGPGVQRVSRTWLGTPSCPCGPATGHLVGTRLVVPKSKIPSVVAWLDLIIASPQGVEAARISWVEALGTGSESPDTTSAPWEGSVRVLGPQGETETRRDSVPPQKSQTCNGKLRVHQYKLLPTCLELGQGWRT